MSMRLYKWDIRIMYCTSLPLWAKISMISSAGDSRSSFMFGLYASPQITRIFTNYNTKRLY